MIAISTLVGGASGYSVIIPAHPEPDTRSARVSRTKTLDGGVHIHHGGVAAGDRTIKAKCYKAMPDADLSTLKSIFEDQTIVLISSRDGLFKGVISSLTDRYNKIELTLLLKESVA